MDIGSLIQSFVQGGFSGTILTNFEDILAFTGIFVFVQSPYFSKLWDFEYRFIRPRLWFNIIAIVFPAAFVFYGLLPTSNWTLYGKSIDQIILSRFAGIYNVGHVLVWLGILTAYFSFCYLNRENRYWAPKSALQGLGMISLCEFYWNWYYLASVVQYQHYLPYANIGGFFLGQIWLAYVIAVNYFFFKKDFLKYAGIVLPIVTVYFSIWYLDGFPVTLSAAGSQAGFITQWYYNIAVNAIEIGSWELIAGISIIAYWIIKHGQEIENAIALTMENRIKNYLSWP